MALTARSQSPGPPEPSSVTQLDLRDAIGQGSPGWPFINAPDKSSDEFARVIDRFTKTDSHKTPPPKNFESSKDPEPATNANLAPCASFGDNGTTATVGAHGNILQISRYLGAGRSGFFSADHFKTPEPYFVADRPLSLWGSSQNADQSLGLRVGNLSKDRLQLDFVHDRWPRFQGENDHFAVSIQYVIRNGAVIQRCSIERKPEALPDSYPQVAIDNQLLIRDLEWLDWDNTFNEYNLWDEYSRPKDYILVKGPHDCSLVLIHYLPPEKDEPMEKKEHSQSMEAGESQTNQSGTENNEDKRCPQDNSGEDRQSHVERIPEAVGLVMTLFANGKTLPVGSWSNILSSETFRESSRIELTMAYRLQLMSKQDNNWRTAFVSSSDTLVDDIIGTASFVPLQFSLDPKLDFVIRRNLEHILSVCCIPTGNEPVWGDGCTVEEQTDVEPEKLSISLTCGDLSGHRLAMSANFFAFRFLLEIRKYLQTQEKEDKSMETYLSQLSGRIDNACQGHLNWIFKKAEKMESGCFGANYWTSGKLIDDDTRYMAPFLLSNTAFQFIKACEFFKAQESFDEVHENTRRMIQPHIQPWINRLHKDDRRGYYAFSRSNDNGIRTYRLEDNVWIWMSLRSIEELDPNAQLRPERLKGEEEIPKNTSSAEAQRNMLKRFTTENKISNRRMLATSRSTRESRFLFRSRDTSLFYAMDLSFFEADSKMVDVWKSTLDVQKYHEHNQDSRWDNPLRYGLALAMGDKKEAISRRPPEESSNTAVNVLMKSASTNGILPGQLSEATKEPEMFSDGNYRDFYWHASFELPYILWMYAKPFLESKQDGDHEIHDKEDGVESLQLPQTKRQSINMSPPATEAFSLPGYPGSGVVNQTKPTGPTSDQKARDRLSMKKTVPFSDLMDQNNIIELSDEWLYKYPDFLDFDSDMLRREDLQKKLSALESNLGEALAVGKAAILDAFTQAEKESIEFEDALPNWYMGEVGLVADVPKSNHSKKGKDSRSMYSRAYFQENIGIFYSISPLRTAHNAKKRLLFLPGPDEITAILCYLGSPDSEKDDLSVFFDRHATYEKYFFEDTAATHNLWETEFHLSFYQLVSKDEFNKRQLRGLPEPSMVDFPGDRSSSIARAAMGFRFTGDFFDRYWTCHVLDYIPRCKSVYDCIHPIRAQPDEDTWRQRKVLELILIDRMLTEIAKSIKAILEKTRKELGVRKDTLSFDVFKNSDYFSSNSTWQRFHQILQGLEDDLEEVLAKLKSWKSREEDRGRERPRWTKNDERKYRRAIDKCQGSNQRKIRDLETYLNNIQSLKSSLKSAQESIREDMNLRGAEDIRFFTYVTVVFLPLGFATSIFSMSEVPGHTVLISMIVTATVALLLTIIALLNARTMASISRGISQDFYGDFNPILNRVKRFGSRIMGTSILAKEHRKGMDLPTTGTFMHLRKRVGKLTHNFWYLWFWVAYALLELPAWLIASTYRDIKNLQKRDLEPNERSTKPSIQLHEPIESPETAEHSQETTNGDEALKKRASNARPRVKHGVMLILRTIPAIPAFFIYAVLYSIRLILLNISDVVTLILNEMLSNSHTTENTKHELEDSDVYESFLIYPENVRPFRKVNIKRTGKREDKEGNGPDENEGQKVEGTQVPQNPRDASAEAADKETSPGSDAQGSGVEQSASIPNLLNMARNGRVARIVNVNRFLFRTRAAIQNSSKRERPVPDEEAG